MNAFQMQSNSVWYTHEPIFSCKSKAQIPTGIEIMSNKGTSFGIYSFKDITALLLAEIFSTDDFVYIREIVSDAKIINKKKERGKMTRSLRYKVLKRDHFRCKICGNTSKDSILEVDHIIPISKGGTSIESNLQTTCFDCNRGKFIS